jgi:hypothetical protein
LPALPCLGARRKVELTGNCPWLHSEQQQAQQQAHAQAQQTEQSTQQQMHNFKKAFSVCLEGKNYMVKY